MRPHRVGQLRPNAAASCRAVAAARGRTMSGCPNGPRYIRVFNVWRRARILAARVVGENTSGVRCLNVRSANQIAGLLVNATALGLAYPAARQMAYTYCSVGISDLKPLTGTSADQVPHTKSRSLATA